MEKDGIVKRKTIIKIKLQCFISIVLDKNVTDIKTETKFKVNIFISHNILVNLIYIYLINI